MRTLTKLALAAVLGLPLLSWLAAPAAADNANVTITDSGFSPNTVSIARGSTVFFTNTGTRIHTASTLIAATPFDTGGLSNNQQVAINFAIAGTYQYTSATDCSNAGRSTNQGFDCTPAYIIVTDSGQSYNALAQNTPTPTPIPTQVIGPPQAVTVHITDSGMNPPSVTVALGGTVSFINDGANMHTATTTGGDNPRPFDSGGLAQGFSTSFSFGLQGTYNYTSAIDCLNNQSSKTFACGPYQIIVSGQTSMLAPSPSSSPVAVAGGTSPTVTIDDVNGFMPAVIQISPGQTVTWTNGGTKVHSVVSNPGYAGQFDSGGLSGGQKFSYTFATSGSYDYHSSTEPSYALDAFGHLVPHFAFAGTVLVQ